MSEQLKQITENQCKNIQKEIDKTDILILCTSVWLGEKSSVCNRVLERMYGYTHVLVVSVCLKSLLMKIL